MKHFNNADKVPHMCRPTFPQMCGGDQSESCFIQYDLHGKTKKKIKMIFVCGPQHCKKCSSAIWPLHQRSIILNTAIWMLPHKAHCRLPDKAFLQCAFFQHCCLMLCTQTVIRQVWWSIHMKFFSLMDGFDITSWSQSRISWSAVNVGSAQRSIWLHLCRNLTSLMNAQSCVFLLSYTLTFVHTHSQDSSVPGLINCNNSLMLHLRARLHQELCLQLPAKSSSHLLQHKCIQPYTAVTKP